MIGYGSVGKKHATILQQLGCKVSFVTAQQIQDFPCYRTIAAALEKKIFDYVIIANATFLHYEALLTLIACDFTGMVLIEKPLFAKIESIPENKIKKIVVAYNLRFHSLLLQTKKLIAQEKLITFSTYVGQYLPHWRKETDYRTCYSAKTEQGGGVLRDLSHELDYSVWLCGPCLRVTAMGGRFSALEINSDDVYSILMECVACPLVNIQLNYVDRETRREIIINTEEKTFFIDLINGIIKINGKIHVQCHDTHLQSYLQQHQAILNNDWQHVCHLEEGVYLTKLIASIEMASAAMMRVNV